MSLIKQLWLTVILILLLAFVGSLAVSVTSTQDYVEQEVQIKNADNANALALSMSQMEKEAVSIELLLAAQFDTGHYRLIELRSPEGEVMERREAEALDNGVPDWFVNLVRLDVSPGQAVVQDGWRQYGTLTLASQHQYAYRTLWQSTLEMAAWFALVGVISLMLAWWIVRSIRRPLVEVISQARSISARRFTTSREPRTLELREVVQAMNTLSGAVHTMLSEETGKLDQLRRRLQEDATTGAYNRTTLLDHLQHNLDSDSKRASGVLVMVRVDDLPEVNERLGRQATDDALKALVEHLSQLANELGGGEVGRLNGSDFLLLIHGAQDIEHVSEALKHQLTLLRDATAEPLRLPAALTEYTHGDTASQRLAALDGALSDAESRGDLALVVASGAARSPLYTTHDAWRTALLKAMETGIALALFPVVNARQEVVHYEAPSRLELDGEWRSAGLFMPWVARLHLEDRLDLAVAERALALIESDQQPLGINLSGRAVGDMAFIKALRQRLERAPEAAKKLWIELPESTALHDLSSFRLLCRELQATGVKIGLEHVGSEFTRLADLHDLGLAFLKFDASLVHGIDQAYDQQTILRGMATLAHSLGILAIAEGVKHPEEAETLFELGLDAVTGPGVKAE
ncbi:EAL domain-containing protein [Vreelandella arcis]|uniref:EAL domain, c-di-GMP-specific phosphodiesterase class I (Or its enzymatically inactive variant) n=1 Tax=Vreelandella arcis TaxID=416873 RepID=A0A1H0JPY0_9GAMM|nr:EAL domain-containing protein [Halomonas arcis]SDO45865.1 EAL domain, c-di-GMP-specific phosphodiesterase class I (or its enzymatically inactive variant) [Halomonas arcis]